MGKKCFFAQPTCETSLSREHVISAAVLRVVLGTPVQNLVRSDAIGGKMLIDHEPVVRDVCVSCNSALSPYDVAGVQLVQQLQPSHDPTNLELRFSKETLGWLLKTHFNWFRVIKDRESHAPYPINPVIKDHLIRGTQVPDGLFQLQIEGWIGEHYYWDKNDPRRIPWFSYQSVKLREQRVVISELRLKTLVTWVLVPSDGEYGDFASRASSALSEVAHNFGFQLQPVDPQSAISAGCVRLTRVLPLEEVKKFITAPTKPSGE